MHIQWILALLVVLGERKKPLTELEAEHFAYVVYRRTIPIEMDEAIRQVREIMADTHAARKATT